MGVSVEDAVRLVGTAGRLLTGRARWLGGWCRRHRRWLGLWILVAAVVGLGGDLAQGLWLLAGCGLGPGLAGVCLVGSVAALV